MSTVEAKPAETKTADAKPSPVEEYKLASQHLRGTIGEELADASDGFSKEMQQLIKTHGFYQQENRDDRKSAGKGARHASFMVRSRIPGGRLTSEQMLAELDVCDVMGNSTLRITSRQGLQLHGIPKDNLRDTIRIINMIKLSTLAACGDVNRNVMCCPAPHNDDVHREMQLLADKLALTFAPRTQGYYEIWLRDDETGEEEMVGGPPGFDPTAHDHIGPAGDDVEPIYGTVYLPRKFKMAIGLPEDNCVDMYANDLSFMAIVEHGKIVGYNVLAGGGMGVTPSAAKTFPAVAHRVCYCTPEQAIGVAVAIVKVQRDYGNRSDRKVARLKYTIANMGLPAFRAKVEEYYGQALPDPHPADVTGMDDHIGWREQGDGRYYYGLNIENGRLYDDDKIQFKAALREICSTLAPPLRLTAHQSILFIDLQPTDKETLLGILRKHHVPLSEDISTVRRWSMACVAKPTCGLAVAESERALPGIIDQFEVELAKLGLEKEEFTLRMTGCPNGCARPYNCDIGLVGKTDGKYTIYVGGRLVGDRLNFKLYDIVPTEEVVPHLVPLMLYFKQSRQPGETAGDFFHRRGHDDLLGWVEQYHKSKN